MSANFVPGGEEELSTLAAMADAPELFDPTGGGLGAVRCQVCAVDIDTETGAPLGPVDESNIQAVENYVLGAGEAELGGQPLLDGGLDGGLPPDPGLLPPEPGLI